MITPEELSARLLYRDGLMLILDKPAGLPVHRGPKGGLCLEDLFDALRFGLPRPPALAHRLDRDTSGCLVLGRHRQALQRLGRLFAAGRVDKTYWAITEGAPPAGEGRIELALGRRSDDPRSWWMTVDPDGQPAVTDYRLLGRAGRVCWLELRPLTGRTHQLRVHLAALGCPVLGDRIYGLPDRAGPPLHLHARSIAVPLYPKRPPIAVSAPPPAHMRPALRDCGLEVAAAGAATSPAAAPAAVSADADRAPALSSPAGPPGSSGGGRRQSG
jgi:tRNA pseudouridine32 synthase/23S rRNA pseudouridine746 synthase